MFKVMTLDEAFEQYDALGSVAFGLEPGDMTLYELFIMDWVAGHQDGVIFGKISGGAIAVQEGDFVSPYSFAMIGCIHTRKIMADVFNILTGQSEHREFNWKDGRIVR